MLVSVIQGISIEWQMALRLVLYLLETFVLPTPRSMRGVHGELQVMKLISRASTLCEHGFQSRVREEV